MTPQEFEELAALYADTPNSVLAEKFGMTRTAVGLYATRRGLKKSEDYRRRIQAERMQGRTHLEVTRDKIRHKAIGRPVSEETRQKHRERSMPSGPDHPNWKGGNPWERFKEPQYQAWRNAVLERDGYVCQECHRQCKKHEKGLAAHHMKEYAQYPELRYEVSNGQTLCRECHMRLHSKEFEIEMVPCACGCGTMIPSKDRYGRPREYVNHHAKRESAPRQEPLIPCACGCGTLISPIGAGGKPRRYLHAHINRKRERNEQGHFA